MQPRWRDIWLSALAAAICYDISKLAFVWYVDTFAPYNLVYGSIGTIIALLTWTYLVALIMLFFAKVAKVAYHINPGPQ